MSARAAIRANRPKRRPIPTKVKLAVALEQLAACMKRLGFVPVEVELTGRDLECDHDPALGIRPVNDAGTDYEPAQHDPTCLIWRPKPLHLLKTTGRRGESKLSISGNGDTSRAAKAERLERRRLTQEEIAARCQMLTIEEHREFNKPRRLQGRGFPKRSKAPRPERDKLPLPGRRP